MPSDASVVFHDVWFRYDSAGDPLFASLSVHLARGFTGIVGANGAGKTTLLRLATGGLSPEQGTVQSPGDAIYCAQRTDDPPAGLTPLLEADDKEAYTLRGRLGVAPDFASRWHSLSHGSASAPRSRPRYGARRRCWRSTSRLTTSTPRRASCSSARSNGTAV